MINPGSMVGSMRIVKMLGEGAMGRVYLAHDLDLRKPVAIKVLHPHLAVNEKAASRFKLEAIVQARLDHPNFVQVSQLLNIPGLMGFVMEYVEGQDLDRFIESRGGKIPLPLAREIMRQLLGALDYAHGRQLVHRDIKPSNIMVLERDGSVQVKIMDFGIAKALDPAYSRGLTVADAVLFTRGYSSPEQVRDASLADNRSDIYSLGVTFYRMLTGQFPIECETDTIYIQKVDTAEPTAPSQHESSLSGHYDRVCLRAIAKSPGDRYQSCKEFLNDLGVGPPTTNIEPTDFKSSSGSNKWVAWGVPAALLIILSAIISIGGIGRAGGRNEQIIESHPQVIQRVPTAKPRPKDTGTLQVMVDKNDVLVTVRGPTVKTIRSRGVLADFQDLPPGAYDVTVDYGSADVMRKVHVVVHALEITSSFVSR